jgi:hypothetical protein
MNDVFSTWNYRHNREVECLQNFERIPGAAKSLELPPCFAIQEEPPIAWTRPGRAVPALNGLEMTELA